MIGTNSALQRTRHPPEAEDPADRRRATRHTTVFQVAKVCRETSQELCILRDISDTGLRAEVYAAVGIGEHVVIEMRTGHRVEGKVMWYREQSIGVHFDAPISVPEVLAHCSFDDRLGRVRPPRIDVDMPGILLVGRSLVDVVIRNISQAGIKVACADSLIPESNVTVRLGGIGQRLATVRWYRNEEAGLLLVQALTYAEFAAWRKNSLGIG